MGKKTENLKNLVEQKINTHEFQEINNIEDLLNYVKNNPKMSIRFDRNQNYEDLPFYVIDDYQEEQLGKIVKEAKKLNCTMLCSNGHKYDNDQLFNFVGRITDNSFSLEICNKKIPLRHIYKEKTTVIKGLLTDSVKNMKFEQKEANPITNKQLETIITFLMNIDKPNMYIEATFYPYQVGWKKEQIVVWQTR